jgi:hypothetical protein
MRKSGLLLLALILVMCIQGLRSAANERFSMATSAIGNWADTQSSLVVKVKKKKHHGDENQNGERSCPPGYVVLDKPNKYGAYCEPKEGFPAKPPAEAEKCKFPGQVGTPPNCSCPDGTEFLGYKGCVAYKLDEYCNDLDATGLDAFSSKCKAGPYYGTGSCATFSTAPPHGSYRCCCYFRRYSQ